MRIQTKGEIATAALMELVGRDRAVPLKEISAARGFSVSYLEQIFRRLKRAKLVTASRGPGGGYLLADGGDAITLDRVIDAVDSVDADGPCRVFDSANEEAYSFLARMTLADAVVLENAP